MKVITKIEELKAFIAEAKQNAGKIAFVPTMGALHKGHLSLVEIANKNADTTVVSIFLNPTQFAPNEDLASYPANIDRDIKLLASYGVGCVFIPTVSEMYTKSPSFWVNDDSYLTKILEGASRPAHFRGVTTIVAKLFNIVHPDISVFGKKDYQQALLIKKMVRDLLYPIKIITGEIVRESDGLAISSRNQYLSPAQHETALHLSEILNFADRQIKNGMRNVAELKSMCSVKLENPKHFKLDYLEICSRTELKRLEKVELNKSVVLIAAFVDKIRLIDNMEV